jgi:peroxiredoxin
MKNTLIFIIVIILAGGAGFILQLNLYTKHSQNDQVIGQQRPEFSAADLNGQLRNIKEWDGKLIFLNFWATWCQPCKKEIPDFIELQTTYDKQDFQIIGIAIDDEKSVREYARKTGINYPVMAVEFEGVALAKRYGNTTGGLPYTVIINRNGEISHTITGELSKKRAKKLMKELGIHI